MGLDFYNNSDKELSLYHDALFLIGISPTDTTTFPVDGDYTRSVNHWLRQVATWIWQATGTWEFDDKNKTDYPIATTTLVDDQHDYTLPTDILKIDKVSVLDNNSTYHLLRPIDKSQIKEDIISEFQKTKGFPQFYDMIGYSIFLYPAPDTSTSTTATKGLRIYFTRDMKEFTPSDTDAEPGFDPLFHRILSYGAALDYAERTNMKDKMRLLNNKIAQMRRDIQEHYGGRNRDFPTRLRIVTNKYN